MKKKLLIAVLGLGTIGGFACGARSMRHHRHHGRSHVKKMVTDICTEAVVRAQRDK